MPDLAHKYYQFAPKLANKLSSFSPRLDMQLQRAKIPLRSEVYQAQAFWTSIWALLGTAAVLALLWLAGNQNFLALTQKHWIALGIAGAITPILCYSAFFLRLPLRIQTRQRDIDAKIPYAINYLAAMSGSGSPPITMLKGLSEQEVYGEVQKEFAWLVRDVEVLGMDLLSALSLSMDRAPSTKLQDFLQGISMNLNTGGDLDTYFQAKSEQFLIDNRQQQEGFLESLGVLAESFVTVVVAAPLFIVVLMSVMTTFASSNGLFIGYILTLVVVPLSQVGFVVAIKTMTPEA